MPATDREAGSPATTEHAALPASPAPNIPAHDEIAYAVDPGKPSRHPAHPGVLLTLAFALGGVAAIVLAVLADQVVVPLRWVVAIVGAALLYMAFCRQLRRWRGSFVDPATWLCTAWLLAVILLAALANVLPLPEGRDPSKTLTTPILLAPGFHHGHLLGTDSQGLDVLAQLLFGARVSLTVGVGATAVALVVGGVIGLLAGYAGGWVDRVISFVTDVVISFPALILLLAMVAFLTPNQFNVALALGVLAVPGYVRLARANAIKIASRDYVTASHTLGASSARIVFRTITPNVLPPMLAYSFITMGLLIVAEASLSYLGVGIQRPTPTWGNMIAAGQGSLETHPSLILAPAVALFLTVLSANMLGQRLQTRWGAGV